MRKKRYRVILFDLDGTLIDNQASFSLAFQKICQRYPDALDSDSYEQCLEMSAFFRAKDQSVAYRTFCKTHHWKSPPSFLAFWVLWTTLYLESSVPFERTLETLSFLKEKGYRLGLITNGNTNFQRAKLISAELLTYFERVYISDEMGMEKPNPGIYWTAAADFGVTPSECLFVGDTSTTDIAGAKNAGMDSLLVGDGEDLLNATYKGEDVSALMKIL